MRGKVAVPDCHHGGFIVFGEVWCEIVATPGPGIQLSSHAWVRCRDRSGATCTMLSAAAVGMIDESFTRYRIQTTGLTASLIL